MNDIIKSCKASYAELLPDVNQKDLDEAIAVTYLSGMTKEELTKATYAYLYPVREPLLYYDDEDIL